MMDENVAETAQVETREARFRKAVEEFYGLGEWDSIHDDETMGGSAERDLRHEEVDALLKIADMIDGHPVPGKLVNLVSTIELPEDPR